MSADRIPALPNYTVEPEGDGYKATLNSHPDTVLYGKDQAGLERARAELLAGYAAALIRSQRDTDPSGYPRSMIPPP